MSQELKRIALDTAKLKALLQEGTAIAVLLYLAKENSGVPIQDLVEKLGTGTMESVKALESFSLVCEDRGSVSLTEEAIFLMDGLLTLAA